MKKMKLNSISLLFLLIATLLIVVGCSGNEEVSNTEETAVNSDTVEEGTPVQGGEAVFAYNTDLSNYDPIKGSAGSDHTLLWPVYETLIKFTSELEPEPGLAESWEFTDNTTLLLNLREGVTFHDGTPFNAEAVKFNIERINSGESNISDLENIEKVEIIDEHTVELIFSQPDSSILLALSDRGGMMASPTAVEEYGEDYSLNPTGAGPFKMVNHIPNGEIVFEAFEEYWQEGQPYLDKMTVKIMAEENTRINALKSGEVDLAYYLSPTNVQSLESDPNIVLKQVVPVKFRMLYINTEYEHVNNKAVRQAILHGIDREAIVQAINFGKGEAAYQPFPADYWASDSELTIEYNPEKAKELLKEAGLENVSITMNHYTTAYEQRIAEAIKSQLSEIGIEVNLQSMELSAAVSNYFSEKEVPVFLSSWTGRPDPQMTINYLFASDSFYNVGGHSTEEIESLISQAASNYNQEERAELYKKINQKAVLEEAIMIPLFFELVTDAMNPSIKGYEPNMLGKPVFSTIWKEQ
ncbi:ABC transporter substrate-binding protein [Oceanobacillus rekensis]|uniref:ABC transporter substrate-binding protein n=1 Tax=Oceanobacillus rekensis TaxID=937927 RepID=UPI000B44939A|nr:ABC transporter substrate-binding protein [Oceanobacillus rekensis]